MTTSPAANLTEPTPEALLPGAVEGVLGSSRYYSGSYWANWLLQQASRPVVPGGINALEWVSEQFTGNWEDASKVGSALTNLAEFNTDWALEAKRAKEDMLHEWGGNAADAANEYFSELHEKVNGQVSDLQDVAHEFQTMAQGVASSASAIEGGIGRAIDLAVGGAITAAAAAATAKTIVGGIGFGAATAAIVGKIVYVLSQVVIQMGNAWQLAEAFFGAAAGFLGGLDGLDTHELPSQAYNHPGVS
ncbi:hypothetical protein [Haloechinothrix sp. LS1_15]|uniref:hypothetical protein n=1 Tax=Haloechinothrix sp. LS1_15 TaxID=2652248 RepID=UPI0029452E16|nr:hypothetical protein [Haloechinothrix sp. LS1_15]MDV6014738.1 hypothetical protein [Haloechinothrix sp. LS1_15]